MDSSDFSFTFLLLIKAKEANRHRIKCTASIIYRDLRKRIKIKLLHNLLFELPILCIESLLSSVETFYSNR